MQPRLEKRRRQLWGPLFAAAHAAGGQWPRRIFDAFVAIALDASEKTPLLPEQFTLLDTADWFMETGSDRIFASDLLTMLRAKPAGQFYRDAETEYLFRSLFPAALGKAKALTGTMLYGEHAGEKGRALGYSAVPVLRAAIELREMLYPPMAAPLADPLEDELAFEPAERRAAA